MFQGREKSGNFFKSRGKSLILSEVIDNVGNSIFSLHTNCREKRKEFENEDRKIHGVQKSPAKQM